MRRALIAGLLAVAGCTAPMTLGEGFGTQQLVPGQPQVPQFYRPPQQRPAILTFFGTERIRITSPTGVMVRANRVRDFLDDARLILYPDGRFTLGPEFGIPEAFIAGRWERERGNIVLRGRSTEGSRLRGVLDLRGGRGVLDAQIRRPSGRTFLVNQVYVRQAYARVGRGHPGIGQGGYGSEDWDIWIDGGDDDD